MMSFIQLLLMRCNKLKQVLERCNKLKQVLEEVT